MNKTNFKIRPAAFKDYEAAVQLDKESFNKDDRWGSLEFLWVLTNASVRSFCAESEGKVVGFAAVEDHKDSSEIVTIAVRPAFRNQGIGGALLAACEAVNPNAPIMLTADAANTEALHFYESNGYTRRLSVPQYYASGHDGIVFSKERD